MHCRKRFRYILLFLLCLGLFFLMAGLADEDAVTGYFTEKKLVRSAPSTAAASIGSISPYTLVSLEPQESTWAVISLPDGKCGYVRYKGLQPSPVPADCEPWAAYSEQPLWMTDFPAPAAPHTSRIEKETLFTVTGTYEKYVYIRLSDGSRGYIQARFAKAAGVSAREIDSITVIAEKEAAIRAYPFEGAESTGTLPAYVAIQVHAAYRDHYAVDTPFGMGFIRKEDTVPFTQDTVPSPAPGDLSGAVPVSVQLYAAQDLPLLSEAAKGAAICGHTLRAGTVCMQSYSLGAYRVILHEGHCGFIRADAPQLTVLSPSASCTVNAPAFVCVPQARLMLADNTQQLLSQGDTVFVYAAWGELLRVLRQGKTGYMAACELEIQDAATLTCRISDACPTGTGLQKNKYLDSALPMLESTNAFLLRYNLLTGSSLTAALPLGFAYFWGGRSYTIATTRAPGYGTMEAWQNSPSHYVQGQNYVYGLDCVGFIQSVYKLTGQNIHISARDLEDQDLHDRGFHLYCPDLPMPEEWPALAASLRPGDVLALRRPGYHVMMYIGTLRDFGYTAEQLPRLAPYLDHPLVIHCGDQPRYSSVFQQLIDTAEEKYLARALTTDGGVGISILGVAPEAAEYAMVDLGRTFYCFDIEGTCVTAFDLESASWYVWYRKNLNE